MLPDYLRQQGVSRIDFIKIDVDGPDFEVLTSIEQHLESLQVLGLAIEVNFFGSDKPTDNTLHNVDRLMRSRGFALFNLGLRRYSTRYLPSRFVHGVAGPTEFGRLRQGDAFYARDLGDADQRDGRRWSPAQILKQCCFFELFGLPDCAAELLVLFRDELSGIADVDALLDGLVPPIAGRRLSYGAYMQAFASNDPVFFDAGQGATRDF